MIRGSRVARPSSRGVVIVTGLLLALALPLASTSAGAQSAEKKLEQARRELAPFDEYFVRDGGRWVSDNPDYQPGSDQPPRYGLEFARKLGGWAITTRIFGIQADGTEVDYWEIVTAWDAETERVVAYQFGRGGGLMIGTGHTNPDGTLEVELHGTGWDGSPIGYRDVFHLEGPDRFVIDAYHPEEAGGELTFTRSNTWTRQTPEGEAEEGS